MEFIIMISFAFLKITKYHDVMKQLKPTKYFRFYFYTHCGPWLIYS